ncbi:hypothetical protein SAMN04488038_104135 [Solimonas aquatica]|uniref:Integral membrane protein n=1 Tax=Solimonas aquatica TaxID=489703 RepID=A0A1H9DR24_9GAMM|nr:hypothetical protein [Solimonas aquatica]SEQ15945.1 hypothetical protein SAMN04488038_104135 [Solimonas aquatica]
MLAADLALLSSGALLLVGMLTGRWKYRRMMASPTVQAPVYVDIAHRASLMYSFAALVLWALAQRSVFSNAVNLAAVAANLIFYVAAIAAYVLHGLLQDTDNQLRRPHRLGSGELSPGLMRAFMAALTAAEIGGAGVLLLGAARGLA